MTDLAGSDLNRTMTAQEAWDTTMIERALRATGREMTLEEATAWYRADRATREAADAE